MSEAMDWIGWSFEATLMAAVAAAPFALVVFLLDASVCRRMPARFRGLLWTLVAVRMLMPFAPASPLSLERLWMPVLAKMQSTSTPDAVLATAYSRPPESWMASSRSDSVVQYLGRTNPFPTTAVAEVDWADIMFSSLLYTWFAGATIVLLRASIASIRFARRLKTISLVHDEAIVAMLDRVCGQVRVRRRPAVKYVADLPAPAVFGVFRPTLCLPETTRGQLSNVQLRMIMLHEVMHLRRRDGYLAWLLTAVRAAHWWNLVSWLVISRVIAYREEACDDGVRLHTELAERRTYVDLLLQFAAARPTANLGLIGIWFARPVRRLSARISAFATGDENRRRVYWPVAVALAGLLAVAGLTDATNLESKETEPQTVADFMSRHGLSPSGGAPRVLELVDDDANDPQKDKVEERTYDVTRALAKLAEINPRADAEQWLMMYSRSPGHNAPSIRRDGNHAQLQLSSTRQQHAFFTSMLAAIERSGPWQVSIEARVFRDTDIAVIGDIDWQEAVKFPLPPARKAATWPAQTGAGQTTNDDRLSLAVESVSYEFAPYMALVIDDEKMRRIKERFQIQQNKSGVRQINSPKITLFSGQTANIRDEAQRPFVVGVNYVKGKLATAAQPEIAVLSEGVRLDVQPFVIDAKKLDLQCNLAVSFIEDVKTTKLPGQEITVQNPRASRKQISARCQLAPGQTLLLAQLPPNDAEQKRGFLCFAISASWFADEAPVDFVK